MILCLLLSGKINLPSRVYTDYGKVREREQPRNRWRRFGSTVEDSKHKFGFPLNIDEWAAQSASERGWRRAAWHAGTSRRVRSFVRNRDDDGEIRWFLRWLAR